MVRRSTDGHIRFSSFNDVQRALTAYTVDNAQSHLERFKRNHKDDVVASMLGSQKLLTEMQQINAQALSACYASDVVETIPDSIDVAEVRATFINRVRQFNALHSVYNKQLATAAELSASRRRLPLPKFVDKLLASNTTIEKARQSWQFVAVPNGKKPYQVFRIYECADVVCTIPDSHDTYTCDKVIGVALPEYNKTTAKEIALFVSDNLNVTPSINRYALAKRSESFIHELRINSIKVGRS